MRTYWSVEDARFEACLPIVEKDRRIVRVYTLQSRRAVERAVVKTEGRRAGGGVSA